MRPTVEQIDDEGSWRALADCIGLADLFVLEEDVDACRAVCAGCGVWTDCLMDALLQPASRDGSTVRGGLDPEQRKRVRREMGDEPQPGGLLFPGWVYKVRAGALEKGAA